MKRRSNLKFTALLAASLLLFGCEKEDDALETLQVKENGISEECYTVTFENIEVGTYVSSVPTGIGNVTVRGYAVEASGNLDEETNRARIFDSENWTGDDDDLRTDNWVEGGNWGHILIVQDVEENALVPNDNKYGAKLILTFPEPVTLNSMRVIDIDDGEDDHPDENASYVQLYKEDGTFITIPLPQEGDGEGYTLNLLGTQNVVRMEVVFDGVGTVGSGGIDHINFCVPEEEVTGCTRTQGYWKTHSGYKPKGNGKGNSKYDATWDDFVNAKLSRLGAYTYPQILWMEPKGGNADLILAHQFIAAELNVAAGASIPDDVLEAWLAAKAYLAGGSASRQDVLAWAKILDDYNNGLTGPGKCGD